jgi:hypothetical protein
MFIVSTLLSKQFLENTMNKGESKTSFIQTLPLVEESRRVADVTQKCN